jgi:hypothetical protein
MKGVSLFALLCASTIVSAFAVNLNSVDLKQKLGGTLGYPPQRITIEDERSNKMRPELGNVVIFLKISGKDEFFAPIMVDVSQRGMPFLEKIQMDAVNNKAKGNLQKVPEKVYGAEGVYFYKMTIAGAGGSEDMIVGRDETRDVDFIAKISISSERQLAFQDNNQKELKNYKKLLSEGGPLFEEALLACAQIVVKEAVEPVKISQQSTALGPSTLTTPAIGKQSDYKSAVLKAPTRFSYIFWIFIGGLVVITVSVALVFWKRY